ncbi:MAG TPA: hypothetical protein DD661_01600 [Gammaproteobacteria bacterium]|jgi:hypothetical protein|nr:hypothetical protein [Gammaproteobacteria bacterium]|tara:strand:- start:126 stop:437 length:312 start_codon:yes stop_codon:yes gene_type:complete
MLPISRHRDHKSFVLARNLRLASRGFRPMSTTMNRRFAFWVAFLSAFLASALALLVAFSLGLAYQVGGLFLASELSRQSRWAAVAALAALVSAIAQIIEKASR